MRKDRSRQDWPCAFGGAERDSPAPKLEGMEVLFDQKVTLFPVRLEEIRDAAPRARRSRRRAGGEM